MKKGEKARVLTKFDYAYGEAGLPPRIPGKLPEPLHRREACTCHLTCNVHMPLDMQCSHAQDTVI